MNVRKKLWSLMAILMLVLLATQTSIVAGAERVSDERNRTEIIVVGDVGEEKERLIIAVINGEVLNSSRNILCLIIGHDIAKTMASGTEHRVWPTSPRCRRTTYDVFYCKRSNCDHVTTTIISQGAIPCCN